MLLRGYAEDDDNNDSYTGYQFMNLGILETTNSTSLENSNYSDDGSSSYGSIPDLISRGSNNDSSTGSSTMDDLIEWESDCDLLEETEDDSPFTVRPEAVPSVLTNNTVPCNTCNLSEHSTNNSIRQNKRVQYDHLLQNSEGRKVNPDWVLLDSQSTVNIFCNRSLLQNIHHIDISMEIHRNTGVATTHQMGKLPGFGMVWYHPNGIANILSLAKTKKKYRVTYNSGEQNAFIVHKVCGLNCRFVESRQGLYYMDTARSNNATVLVNTVEAKKAQYRNE